MAVKRKRKGKREANGRLSRRKGDVAKRGLALEAETLSVALGARMRHQGISRKNALDPARGSALGLVRISEEITQRQYEAGIKWDELNRRFHALTGASVLAARSGNDFEIYGRSNIDPDDPDQIDLYLRVRARHKEARRAILDSGPLGEMAVQLAIDEDQKPGRLVGDLRLALNALARVFEGKRG